LLSPGTISLSRLSLNSRWFLPLKSRIFRSNLGVSVGVRVRVRVGVSVRVRVRVSVTVRVRVRVRG